MTPDFKTRIEITSSITGFCFALYSNGKLFFIRDFKSIVQARRMSYTLLKLFNGKYVYVIDRSWKNGTIEKYKLYQDGSKKFY